MPPPPPPCLPRLLPTTTISRPHTTSAQYVATRHLDPTFEKLMSTYKHLLKVISIQDLILASPSLSLPLPLLSNTSQHLRLTRGAPHFIQTYPHIFSLIHDPTTSQTLIRLTPAAAQISRQESAAVSIPAAVSRLNRLLSISPSHSLPLRAIFKIWRELALPDDFEDSVIHQNPNIFSLKDNPKERNTHILELRNPNPMLFTPAVEKWREGLDLDEIDIRFAFKQGFPPGMKLSKNFRAKLKEWQRRAYLGPYEAAAGRLKAGTMEKRAVGIVHEFLSLTVEKMVEVEKISQFRRWFGIELNIRDLFLDHPGMFYLSTKGKRHTVFLREAYERGRLIESNPIYEARMRLLELVQMRRRGVGQMGGGLREEEEEVVVSNDEDEDAQGFCRD